MPDVYVYPGGAVDPADGRARPGTPLDPEITARLAVGGSSARARSLAMAAVRETWEETGLLVTVPGNPGAINEPSWKSLADQGVTADLARLRYIGRAITPTIRPRRFHARFFAVDGSTVEGTLQGNGELIDLAWVNVNDTGDLPMRGVTRYMLERTLEMLESKDPAWIGDTMFTQRNGKLHVSRQKF